MGKQRPIVKPQENTAAATSGLNLKLLKQAFFLTGFLSANNIAPEFLPYLQKLGNTLRTALQ